MSSTNGAKVVKNGQRKALEAFEKDCKRKGIKYNVCGSVGMPEKGNRRGESFYRITAKTSQGGKRARKRTFKIFYLGGRLDRIV